MRLYWTLMTACAFFSMASAKVINITVGVKIQYDFLPHFVKDVKVNDTLNFYFDQNHSVNETTVDSPCTPKPGGISGAAPTEGLPEFRVNILDTAPKYFASLAGDDCKSGMVFIMNPPPPDSLNWDDFHTKAMGKEEY